MRVVHGRTKNQLWVTYVLYLFFQKNKAVKQKGMDRADEL